MLMTISKPTLLSDHVQIPPDTTPWVDQAYFVSVGADGQSTGKTPNRPRATFGKWQAALIPRDDPVAMQLVSTYGVYLLAFDVPHPALYVGIAAGGGKSPEGVLSRIRKHRVKLSGSHVGPHARSNGGVNHTAGWREYATLRACHSMTGNEPDQLQDARIAIGELHAKDTSSDKLHLAKFEALISRNHLSIRDRLCRLLWPTNPPASVRLLTTAVAKVGSVSGLKIGLWDGTVVRF